jgi:hypothetical protein
MCGYKNGHFARSVETMVDRQAAVEQLGKYHFYLREVSTDMWTAESEDTLVRLQAVYLSDLVLLVQRFTEWVMRNTDEPAGPWDDAAPQSRA